ncbi:latrophilin Cirl-like isoform X2 [Tachypleus tridentatus]|uniref:latrophilin Cirl-like isoform X2 n=1 Tax=Tachypleus tridentatus TaxID=6853 RepID=UPI003FD38F9B
MVRETRLQLMFLILCLLLGLTVSRRGVSVPNFSIRPPHIERYHYTSTYACEGRELKISCNDGDHIRLVRANYGRFSISICNDKGNTDWSVICMSDRSFLIMQDRCSGKSSCSVFVSSESFGDPCPGTLKYLEVQYHCISPNSRIGSNSPTDTEHPAIDSPYFHTFNFTNPAGRPIIGLWLNNGTLNLSKYLDGADSKGVGADRTGASVTPMPKHFSTERTISVTQPYSATRTTPIFVVTTEKEKENVLVHGPVFTSIPEETYIDPSRMCSPTSSHNLYWNWTAAGEINIQSCPGGATGLAKWRCGADMKWTPKDPDLKECKSVWVDNLRERMHGGDSINSVTMEMALMTLTRPLFSKDITHVTSMIHQTLRRALNNMDSYLEIWRRHQTFKELLESVVETVSNLLEEKHSEAWLDLSRSERKQVASHLLQGLEESAFLLAETLVQGNSYLFAKNNVLLSVLVMEVKHSKNVLFPVRNDIRETSWVKVEDLLFLPVQALADLANNGLVRIILRVYNKVDELLQPGNGFQSPVLPIDKANKNISWTINSRIVAASVGRRRMVRLSEPVIISLKHIQEENATNAHCVYWDVIIREWSGEGCWVKKSNISHTVCACNHLTNFAVLMEVKPLEMAHGKNSLLQILTSTSCALCGLFVLATIAALHLTKNLQTDRITIQKNLCLCLLGAELVFATGISQTHIRTLCGVVAGLLHYFLLAVFAWVFVEGFHLYVLLIEVYESEKSRAIWYHGLGYGIPIIIVSVSAIVDPYSYGTKEFCWLRTDNYFIFSFVGPAVGILFGSAVFLCIAMCILCYHSGVKTMVKGKEETKLKKLKSWIRWASVLIASLSSTWAVGLLYVSQSKHIFAYIFGILNCILGVLIFIFYFMKNEKIKEEVRTYFQQLKWLPESMKQSKNQSPSASFPSSRIQTTPQLSVANQPWNSQDKTFTILPKFTTSDCPATTTNQESKFQEKRDSDTECLRIKETQNNTQTLSTEYLRNASKSGSSSEVLEKLYGFTGIPLNVAWHYSLQDRHKHYPYQKSSGSSDKYSTYPEHIYESIDNDTVSSLHCDCHDNQQASHRFICSHNLYGEHSDLSQHSSSSGYDQRPLLVTSHPDHGKDLSHDSFSLTSTPELPRQHRSERAYGSFHKKFNSDRLYSSKFYKYNASNTILNSMVPLEQLHLHTDQEQSEWTKPLPDLLHANSENAVIAVLEGEKVVNRLHPEVPAEQGNQFPLNFSTYC